MVGLDDPRTGITSPTKPLVTIKTHPLSTLSMPPQTPLHFSLILWSLPFLTRHRRRLNVHSRSFSLGNRPNRFLTSVFRCGASAPAPSNRCRFPQPSRGAPHSNTARRAGRNTMITAPGRWKRKKSRRGWRMPRRRTTPLPISTGGSSTPTCCAKNSE